MRDAMRALTQLCNGHRSCPATYLLERPASERDETTMDQHRRQQSCSLVFKGLAPGAELQLPRKLGELLRRSLLKAQLEPSSNWRSPQVCKLQRNQQVIKKEAQDQENQASSRLEQRQQKEQGASCERSAEQHDVDGGYAWVVLVVIFIINASTFGTARAYGLIFDKLARREGLASRTEAALPFTIMGAVENMAGPLSGYLAVVWANSWRRTVFMGSCLITLAHLFAALTADSLPGQLLSMGLMCGLGLSLVSISFFQLNNAYFVRYRSTAFGLGMTGAAFGTLYISPLCQFFLDNYGISACYLMLSAILLPNVPLALLLKPKASDPLPPPPTSISFVDSKQASKTSASLPSVAQQVEQQVRAQDERSNSLDQLGLWLSVKRVFCNPIFHLIWPTQLLFCWFNFVFGMIIVDFGRDRQLAAQQLAHLVPVWAFGQLVGRLCLSSFVDFKWLTYKSFTVICFFAISLTTYLLNLCTPDVNAYSNGHLLLALVFVLSMFIALLYILLNGLVVSYVEPGLQPLSLGVSSFTGSFFLLPRANIIGYYRDQTGNYDQMLTLFALVSLAASLTWLLVPPGASYLRRQCLAKRRQVALRVHYKIQLDKAAAAARASTRTHIITPSRCWHLDQVSSTLNQPQYQRQQKVIELNTNVYSYPA